MLRGGGEGGRAGIGEENTRRSPRIPLEQEMEKEQSHRSRGDGKNSTVGWERMETKVQKFLQPEEQKKC